MDLSLHQLSLVDSPATEDFDRFTRLATKMLGVPVALVSIIDFENDRQFFTSACGLGEPWASDRQTPLTHSFCQHVVTSNEPLIVEDARQNPLVRENLAIPDLDVIAYLGIPVAAPDGKTLGALCAIDSEPRKWAEEDVAVLSDLAASVTSQIGLRAAVLANEIAQKSANRLGHIVDNSYHEVFTFDPDTLLFTNVNKGACQNLGYTLQEIKALTPIDIKPDFDLAGFKAHIAPLLNKEVSELEFETRHIRKDGSTYPVSIRLEHHHDEIGAAFIAFCIDISRRRQLEKALREESENFSALFNHVIEPMMISDPDTSILLANPACLALFGSQAKDLIGFRFLSNFSEKDQAEIKRKLEQATPDSPFFTIFQDQELNGQSKTMIWSNITHFVDGQPTKIFTIGNDVTELNEAKIRAEDNAEQVEKAMEVRKVFLANMSHEVRTPLNAIMGLFQLIQMGKDVPDQQKKQAQVGLDASHHLLAQLVNVLDLSKVEAKAVEITTQMTDIRPLAQQWLETAKATKQRLGKPIEVSLEIAENTLEQFNLDARRVTQIVNNLTDNALKFTKEGQVVINIHQAPPPSEQSDGAALEITVSDTGCGIAPGKEDIIFERFGQVDGALTRENNGSGLGLAISRELSNLMDASLDVMSPSANACFATTFSLTLQPKEIK